MPLTTEDLQRIRSLIQTMISESEKNIIESVKSNGDSVTNRMIAHIGDLKQQVKK